MAIDFQSLAATYRTSERTVRRWDELGLDVSDALDVARHKEITVRINSPGGNVFDGLAIYQLLKSHSAKIMSFPSMASPRALHQSSPLPVMKSASPPGQW
jgi:hypothetical protein